MPNKEIIALEKELERIRLEPPGSELVVVLNELAYAGTHSHSHESEAYAREANDLAEKLGLPVEQAKSCRTLGMINLDVGNFTEAMSLCRKSMEIYEKLGDKEGLASVHSTMATIYKYQGMIDKALEHHYECLRRKQEYGASEDELATCYLNLGASYGSLNRFEQAQSFYEYARSIWEKSGNREGLAFLYNNLGSLYGRKEELDKAQEYFQKTLDLWEDIGDKSGIATALCNLGRLSELLGDNESALDFFIRSLELDEEIGNRREIAYTCGCIGGIYTELGRLDEAEKLITRGLSITRKLSMKDIEILCLEKITDLYKAKGDLQKALSYSRELKTCLEEHLNEKSMEKVAGLQVQFETEKKEKEAEIYRLKNMELSDINDELREALAHVKTLQGMLPICASCKKVRDDDGYWQQIESYISEHSDAKFSHGLCPECMIRLYGKDFTLE
ncbi:MAG: tetratricopeptide repeat protein [Candidatus Aegiribacteria sp.]|nr:tetratricopeptide repeat protein [Candidatus Aegiribacteria sp.]